MTQAAAAAAAVARLHHVAVDFYLFLFVIACSVINCYTVMYTSFGGKE